MSSFTHRKFSRICALVLILCMVISIAPPVQVQAAEDEVIDKSTYDMNPPNPGEITIMALNSGYILNSYIEAYINSYGYYTIGTVEGDPNSDTDDNQKLLFGHPDSSTTNTLIRIDGVDYWFTDYVTDITFNDEGTECTATAVINGVKVQQILTLTVNPYTNISDLVRISYKYTNTTTSSKQIGVRIMLDTMLGSNDGSPFRVNGQDVTKEVEFAGNAVPQYWQSFDSLESPNVTSTGIFYFSQSEKPDKVQFAAWPNIVSAPWEFEVDNSQYVTGDSAVAAYFNPRTVPAGGNGSVTTYYGVSGFSGSNSDLDGELIVRITAPSALYGSDLIGGYLNNPFDVSVYVTSPGAQTLANVRAVLNLSGAPQLMLDGTQSTTIQLGDLTTGQNATVQWTLRAIPQGTSTTANYSVSFYTGNQLIKTMDLSLVLNELNEEDMYRTVRFDVNGGDSPNPPSQRVLIGTCAEEPEDPTREGYVFCGWYANRNCTGLEWFNFLNLYNGNQVTEDVTLYAKWEKDMQTLNYGIDTFQFRNTDTHFFEGSTGTYMISGDYYDVLLDGLGGFWVFGEKQRIKNELEATWDGSCFGMSATLSLLKADKLDHSYFQDYTYCTNDLDYPKDNQTIFNLINYYHVMQMTNTTQDAREDYDKKDETANNEAIVKAVMFSDYPVVVGFNILKLSGKRLGGHAVVAYGYTKNSDGYNIKIWDPNDRYTPNVLVISEDYTTSSFLYSYDDSDSNLTSYMKYALTVEDGLYDYKNIQEKLTELGHSSGADANALYSSNTSSRRLNLITNYDSFKIEASDGTYAVITEGYVTDGTLNISDADYYNDYGYELELSFEISAENAAEYRIIPMDTFSVVTGELLDQYRTIMFWDNPAEGFYAEITAADTGAITIGPDGTVNTEFDASTMQEIVVVSNASETPWYSVTVEGTSTGMTVIPGSDGTVISSEEDTTVTVSAEDDYNTIVFETIDLVAEEEVELYEDPENPGTGVIEAERRSMGNTLIFMSRGGTPIEAQRNIPDGGCATRPADPTRYGFVFDGWYTNPECTDGNEWDFNTPIYQDTKIYAKWLMDEYSSHTVTFRAEGHDDIVIIVCDGESLNADQIPAVPAKEGYTGEWDIQDFTNITADMIVNAVYTEAVVHAKFISVSTFLGGNIGLNFYVRLSDEILADPNAYMQFTFDGRVICVPLSEGEPVVSGGNTNYRFTCEVTSKHMTDYVVAQVMNAEGPVGNPKSMNVATYCNWMIQNSTDEELTSLMKAMLNYGAAAQVLFNHHTDNLANAELDSADQILPEVDATAYAHLNSGSEPGIKVTSMTLLLDSETTVRFYFQLTGSKSIEDYTFLVNGEEAAAKEKNGMYYVEVRNIAAHRLDKMHEVKVGGITLRYSALSYVNQVMHYSDDPSLKNLAKAMYAYFAAASAYAS